MRRKVKKRHWGWIVAGGIVLIVLIMPLDIFVEIIYETQKKVQITEALLISLTETVKAGVVLVAALAALIFYKVVK